MFAPPQNVTQNINNQQTTYPTGNNIVPVPQPPSTNTQTSIPPVTPTAPIVQQPAPVPQVPTAQPQNDTPMTESEKRKMELQNLINQQTTEVIPNNVPIQPVSQPQPTETPQPIQVSTAPVSPQISQAEPPTPEVPPIPTQITEERKPVLTMPNATPTSIPVQPTQQPATAPSTDNQTNARLAELEQRILKLEQTVNQWV